MIRFPIRIALTLITGALLLTGCAPQSSYPDSQYWQQYTRAMQSRGLMRTERFPEDVPFSNADLLEAFRRVIFYSEYGVENGRYVPRNNSQPLEKRKGPVTFALSGRAVTDEDERNTSDVIARLSEATGLEFRPEPDTPDLIISIVGPVERQELAQQIRRDTPFEALANSLAGDLDGAICTATSIAENDRGDLVYLITIPAELDGLLRRSCLEEEIAQTLGPSADWDGARPSIFNDDEEFALLTGHDAWLLRLLYDPRLTAGMSERDAMPIVRRILAEIRPEGARPIDRPSDQKRESDGAIGYAPYKRPQRVATTERS